MVDLHEENEEEDRQNSFWSMADYVNDEISKKIMKMKSNVDITNVCKLILNSKLVKHRFHSFIRSFHLLIQKEH